jgi:DNA-binding SARP family transcriptional activator
MLKKYLSSVFIGIISLYIVSFLWTGIWSVEMATKRGPISEHASKVQLDWHQLNELLRLGQYELVGTLLDKAQVAGQQTSSKALKDILTAVHQICLVCGQCQAEVAWHQKAHAEAIQRERRLKQQLETMLDLVRSPGLSELLKGHIILPIVSTVELGLAEYNEPEPEKRFSLWQWAQSLLGRKPGSQSIGQETPTGSIETLATSPAEEAEAAAGDLSGKAEILLPPSTEEVQIPTPMPTGETESDIAFPSQEETEPADFSSVKEVILLTAEAETSSLPLIEEIDTSGPFPLPSDTAETRFFADEIMIATAEETSPIIDEKPEQHGSPTLVVYCLGFFRVYQDDQPIQDWKSSKGKAIFKYLVTHRGLPIAKEVLMELFWPDSAPDAARNNLNVAIYGLRQTLRQTQPDLSPILFQDDGYLLKPALQIWVDVESFMEHFRMAQNLEQRGELTLAIQEYRIAEALYQGEFLADDRYEEWPIPQRQRLEADYFSLLDRLSRYYLDQEDYDACATVCKKMLAVDPCREEAHRRLMRYYSQQNQRYLALRQYHLCVEALANELNVGPSQTTIELYEQIRRAQ